MSDKVDRAKVCPFLLRCFLRSNAHNRAEQFQSEDKFPKEELQIYTWMDATLREITNLIQGVHSLPRKRNARIDFALVFPDRNGKMLIREIGSVHSTRPGPADKSTLKELRFQIGDYVDIAVHA